MWKIHSTGAENAIKILRNGVSFSSAFSSISPQDLANEI
jgi:hypothetical protein